MLRVAAKQLLIEPILSSSSRLSESRAFYHRITSGKWPEPITQQTLAQFLRDINYFEEPKQLINIGLKIASSKNHVDNSLTNRKLVSREDVTKKSDVETDTQQTIDDSKINDILEMLSVDADIPALSYDDVRISKEQLINMAINSGIFRDLFTEYTPSREHIKFRKEQADNLDKLVPHYWITDQPYARVDRKYKDPDPLPYFEPVIGISARFVHSKSETEDNIYAHTAYYGNFIPACDASTIPSITLDGRLLSPNTAENIVGESQFNNWTSGQVSATNFDGNQQFSNKYYTIALVNLDYLHENACNLHWLISDINLDTKDGLTYEQICKYLPVHGIQGFGYSRYVFLVFMHDSKITTNMTKIDDFSIDNRKFNFNEFITRHKNSNLIPVGLSWFQTSWDISSNDIFHNYIKQEAPVFEHLQDKLEKLPEKAYPGPRPFNSYLDHYRDKKSINEQVLLERLKNLNPTDYDDQYVRPKVPPTVFVDEGLPSWMANVMFKKKNKIGYWRGLRPASKILPLNNNADLDYPIRPLESTRKRPPGHHNSYPARLKYRPHIVMPYNQPATEQQSVFIQQDNEVHLEEAKRIMKDYEPKSKNK